MEPDRPTRLRWTAATTAYLDSFIEGLPDAPASDLDVGDLTDYLTPPPEEPGDFDDLLARFGGAAAKAIETAGPRYFAYFPAGGLYSSVLAETLGQVVNRYTGVAGPAPALAAMEHSVLRWLCDEFALPAASSGGVFTSGASIGTLTALHAAREHRLGGPDPRGTIYVTAYTHHCVAKAARIAGFTADQVRVVPVDDRLRMDVTAAEQMITRDRAVGLRPFFLVGTAGTTSTGTVDVLTDVGEVARRHEMWLHVDGAYGGAFQLTDRGRALLGGIEDADSIVLDPHKSLFLPFGTGVLLVRDQELLRAAHSASGDYLQDLPGTAVPDPADLSPELTRANRGLRLWLPLHLHGVAAFRQQLDEKLDLTALVHKELSAEASLEVPLDPDLTVTVFRAREGDAATSSLLTRLNATQRIYLSSTRVHEKTTIRLCVLSFRTHNRHVVEALEIIRALSREDLSGVALSGGE